MAYDEEEGDYDPDYENKKLLNNRLQVKRGGNRHAVGMSGSREVKAKAMAWMWQGRVGLRRQSFRGCVAVSYDKHHHFVIYYDGQRHYDGTPQYRGDQATTVVEIITMVVEALIQV